MFGKALIWVAKEALPLVPAIKDLIVGYVKKDSEKAKHALLDIEGKIELRMMERERGG